MTQNCFYDYNYSSDDGVYVSLNPSVIVDAEIDEALDNINIEGEGLVYTLNVDGREAGTINIPEDQFLENVTYDAETKELVFKIKDGGEIRIYIGDFIKDVPTKLSQLENDTNFISAEQADEAYQAKGDYATEEWVNEQGFLKEHQDLSEYAKSADVTAEVAAATTDMATETWVNGQGFLTEHQSLEGYATEEWVNEQGFLKEHQDLSEYAKSADVATEIATATADMATETWVDEQGFLTEHQDLSEYAKSADVTAEIAAATDGVATEEWVNEQGFLKEHQDLSAYVTGGDYNSQAKAIELKNGDTVLASIDATDFIKDGMVSEVKIEGGNLVITFNSDSGKEDISIPLTDIFNPANYYTKTEANNKFVVRKIDGQNGSYALIFNESDGGGSQYYNGTANVISYVGTNDGDANGICVQIYSKDKATNEGVRINVNPSGAYYGVGASTPIEPYNEIAVKGDVSDLNTQIGNELAQKDATIAALKNDVYALKQVVGNMGGAVTYDLPGEGKSFNALMSNNGTVKLSDDVETGRFGPGMAASNEVTLNLNAHTLEVDTTGDYASILARGTQTITIKGSGANSKIVNNGNGKILWVASTGATANIQSGNFIGNGASTELIYCENGTINITGGTFRNSTEDKRYLLNCKDANFQAGTAKIIVSSTSKTSGPKFYDFDPSNNPEGEGTTYVAEGCHVISEVVTEDDVQYTVYTVVKDA